MSHQILFETAGHRNILLEDFNKGPLAVQANQHVIVHGQSAMILDPGGHKVYARVLSATLQLLGQAKLESIFLSHQDPDIIAATNGWLMTTDAKAYISALWTRFVPHFGLDQLVESRLLPIPDEGTKLDLGGLSLLVLPAHFLHSPGNFQIYDPVSKILYSGDLGASVDGMNIEATNFDEHVPRMKGFHERYMCNNRAMRGWAHMVRQLDIAMIAPQHGRFFRGPMVGQFIDWCESLSCGTDLLDNIYRIPA